MNCNRCQELIKGSVFFKEEMICEDCFNAEIDYAENLKGGKEQ